MKMNRGHDAFNISFEPIETTTTTTEEADEEQEETMLIDTMIKNNKVALIYDAMDEPVQVKKETAPLLYDAMGEVVQPKKPKARVVREDSSKTIHTLFEYMQVDFLDKMRLDYEEIYQTFSSRAKPLLRELEEDRELIMEMIDTFITRMVFNLITQDKVAVKVRSEMVDRIEALYDHRNGEPVLGVRNDFANTDYVNRCISERCKEAREPATDPIDARFSAHKRRGRHPKAKVEEAINEIQAIAGEYIAKRLGLLQAATVAHNNALAIAGGGSDSSPRSESDSSPRSNASPGTVKAGSIDYYPIFQQTLETYNRCIPKQNNHGFYIKTLLHLIRTLDSKEWPLHGLMKMINNMNYCIHAESVKLRFDRSKKRFYSCYSGKELLNNQTVTCIRLVENDAERLKEWRENPILMGKPFEATEFTRSIGAFYLEKEVCCPSTLFYTPFSESYMAQFPNYFDKSRKQEPQPVVLTRVTSPKKKKRKRKVALQPLPPVEEYVEYEPVAKKAKTTCGRIVLTSIKCEEEDDDLFGSLAKYATPTTQAPANLRYCMASLMRAVEVTDSWYSSPAEVTLLKKRYLEEKRAVHLLLDKVTKKNFYSQVKAVILRTLVTGDEEADNCYTALLDFVEALILPEKKLAKFGATQKNLLVRGLLHEARNRARERTQRKEENPLMRVCTLQGMAESEWFRACPLLFMLIYSYMVTRDGDGLLQETYTEYMGCEWRNPR